MEAAVASTRRGDVDVNDDRCRVGEWWVSQIYQRDVEYPNPRKKKKRKKKRIE